MKFIWIFILAFTFPLTLGKAQITQINSPTVNQKSTKKYLAPKRELRAAWVTTYANLDWPSKKNLAPKNQQKEFLDLLNAFQKTGINAVFVQIRPSADAFYKSDFVPWSEYLSGKQGKAPEPFYDPLEFMIEACHARNIEFHAWFNPYRAISHNTYSSVSPNHVARKNPDWIFAYGKSSYFNPGVPEVQNHFIKSVLEVVEKYDLDGVHFDDYYYPYEIYGKKIPDHKTFSQNKKHFKNIKDWRRDNIDRMMKNVAKEIKACKPFVKLGVSPLGVWRNESTDSTGSKTYVPQTTYDHLYADVKKWMEKGWVDYVAPQLYWDCKHRSANYVALVDWWNEQNFRGHLYVGHAIYKVEKVWKNDSELLNQIRYARNKNNFCGSAFYRAKSILQNPKHVNDSLKKEIFKYPALIPTMPWLDSIPPPPVENLQFSNQEKGIELTWNFTETAQSFVIYRFEAHENIDLNDASKIISIQKNTSYLDEDILKSVGYKYVITATDRLHNESLAKNIFAKWTNFGLE